MKYSNILITYSNDVRANWYNGEQLLTNDCVFGLNESEWILRSLEHQ